MNLLADHNLPFAVALGLMLAFAALQLFGLGDMADHDVEADAADGGAIDGLLGIFGFGRVPLMMWIAVFLLSFAAIGVGTQAFAINLTGAPMDIWLACLIAAVAALPVTGGLVRPLAHILPGTETSAVGIDSLVGRRARIVTGRAASGYPARAKVDDEFGHPHHVMVEPHHQGSEIGEGEEILLVRRHGEIFYAVVLEERRLAPV